MKNWIKKYQHSIIIVVVSLFLAIPLLSSKLDVSTDDGIQHLCRLIGTWQSITQNKELGAVFENFCNDFGYSWNIFYSPITAYIPLIFKVFTNSFTVVLKISLWAMLMISGFTMYLFAKKISPNSNIALFASILYMIFPYHLTDMYIRIAFAEHASFIFLPLVFLGLYEILQQNKKSIYFIVGMVGMILTHTVMSMFTAIIGIIYIIASYKKLDKNKIKFLILSSIFIILITSFHWSGLLEHKLSDGNYEVFIPGRMERTEVLEYYKLNFINLFYTKSGMSFELGWIIIIGLFATPFCIKNIKEKGIYIFSLVVGLLCLFMTLNIFPFERLPSILKMIQFSYRLLEFSCLFLSLVVAINFSTLLNNFNIKDVIILGSIAIILVIPLSKCLIYTDKIDEQRLINIVPLTEKTGRVHAGMASFEYLPHNAFENKEYIIKRQKRKYYIKWTSTNNKRR